MTKEIFVSLLENFDPVKSRGELQRLRCDSDSSPDDKQQNMSLSVNNVKRWIMESFLFFYVAKSVNFCHIFFRLHFCCEPIEGMCKYLSKIGCYRCMVMELASCLIKGANGDLVESIFNFIKQTFQVRAT